MDIVKAISDDIQKRLAAREMEVIREVLGARVAAMTFRELKAVLASPIGKPLLDHTIGDLIAAKSTEPSTAKAKARAKTSTVKGKVKPSKAKTATAKKTSKVSASKSAKTAARKSAKTAKTSSAATSSTGKGKATQAAGTKRARQSSSQRKAYVASILTALANAGDWVRTGDLRRIVGGNIAQLHYSMRLLTATRHVERVGERNLTQYRIGRSRTEDAAPE